jgi:signal transduction histidine kinase/ActR/RegA family two-component response regulator
MFDSIQRFFSAEGFMPHGMCYLWRPDVLGLHVLSDALIGLAYFSIPFTLLYFVRKRRDLEFNWMFVCFAVFIVACGTTHLMEIWTVWHPTYWLSGTVKAITALASVPTAVLLVKLIPTALKLPSPSVLRVANAELERQIVERQRAEDSVRKLNEVLEERVAQRTQELEKANERLRQTQQSVLQQERLRALGQMASGIAHDINNAISPAMLYTESLLETEPNLSSQTRAYLISIQRSMDDVAATVSRMREFYRQRPPQMVLEPVQLNTLVQQTAELTRARWSDIPQQRGVVIELQLDLASDLPVVMGVESELRVALTNLIFNAVDAMPEGGRLTLRTKVVEADEMLRPVQLEVSDTGVGMDEDTSQRCLEPFFTTKGERGTGLGLAMVYGIAHRHSADLEIESDLGKGTTVRLIFVDASAGRVLEPPETVPQVSKRCFKILLVDDDPLLLNSLCDVLGKYGHEAVTANGGQAGIDLFKSATQSGQPFDIVITDLGMPYVDGRQVAAAVKAHSHCTPVVLLTGWGQRLIAENDIPPHVDRILSKPPRLNELRTALSDLVRQVEPG